MGLNTPIVVQQTSSSDFSILQRVRELVLQYGWNTTAYQILNPGISYWFSSAQDAVIGYVERHGVRIVAGAPICDKERLPEIVVEFERASAQQGLNVCYFCAESRLESVLRDSADHSMALLGAQPVWQPQAWPCIFDHHASLKAQLNRARNKGVTVSE